MVELIEDQNPERSDVERYVDIMRRRHLYFLLPFFAAWLIVWGISWVLPPLYKSTTQILVEQPTMPENYVAPNVNQDLQAQLQTITQQILSESRLASIIDKLHLYPQQSFWSGDRISRMGKDIKIELVKDPRNNAITAFRVSYSAPNPQTAQAVTTELTNLFIRENTRVREQQSVATTKFMEDQLEQAQAQLAEQEAKVKAFEAGHQGALPSQSASNMTILSGLQSQLQNEEDSLNQSKQQRVYLQALIDHNRALRGQTRADGTPSGLAEVNQQLERLRT